MARRTGGSKLSAKAVYIEWMDSANTEKGHATQVWRDIDEADLMHAARLRSIGFIIREDETTIVVAGHADMGKITGFTGELNIPKRAIVKRKAIKL